MDSVIYNGPYKANYESLSLHRTPNWFRDAKFGIAVNYGIYSVAGVGERGYGGNYYTDTYTNTMYGTLRSYHNENWGEDFERDDFIPLFNAKCLNAEEFRNACRRNKIPFCAYFNLEDTDYPIADPGTSELFVREWTQIGSMQRADKNSYEQLHPYNPEKEERRLQGKIPVHDYVDD
ncbi:MAG: alpha-L-fucosidase [Bacteroidales bacterium]